MGNGDWSESAGGVLLPPGVSVPNDPPAQVESPEPRCQECGTLYRPVLQRGNWPKCGHTSWACKECLNAVRLSCPVCTPKPPLTDEEEDQIAAVACAGCGDVRPGGRRTFTINGDCRNGWREHRWICRHPATILCPKCNEDDGLKHCMACGENCEYT